MSDTVVLVARSYGWRCPECGDEHIISASGPQVTCSRCGTVFRVALLEHPAQARRVDLEAVGREPVGQPVDGPPPPPEVPPFDEWEIPVELTARPVPAPGAPRPAPPSSPPPAHRQQSLFGY
jgi:ribosomal protein S27AE